MKSWKSLALALGVLVMSATTGALLTTRPDTRGVGPVNFASAIEKARFDRAASTGLFVGVREFPHDPLLRVPYAVDDAVDLAHRLSLDQRSSLVPPRRVVLALSGTPQKEESKRRLQELRDAGAKIVDATQGDILFYARKQATLAGKKGLFALSVASHGFLNKDGDAYILGSKSGFKSIETSVKTATLLDIAGRAGRSLIFVDACRERVPDQSRSLGPNPATTAPWLERMNRVHGQVIFYAAAAGQYAFDDDIARNGVFTKAVLDGLNCDASAPRGCVIAETLATYVEHEVREWIRDNRNENALYATQVSMDGVTRNMPLSECWRPERFPIRVEVDGSMIRTYSMDSKPLWNESFREPIVHAEAADLDADAFYEVVVGLRDRIAVFDRDGNECWTTKRGNGATLRAFATGDLREKHTNQIVAVWGDALAVFNSEGKQLESRDVGMVQHIVIGRPTNMHAPKIVIADAKTVFVLHAQSLKTLWRHTLASPIERLRIADVNNDSRREIGVVTKKGTTWFAFEEKKKK